MTGQTASQATPTVDNPESGIHERGTQIRFADSGNPILSTLEVRTRRRDLMPEMSGILRNLRVQVVWAVAHAHGSQLLHELRVVEFDGARLSTGRQGEIVEALRNELEIISAYAM